MNPTRYPSFTSVSNIAPDSMRRRYHDRSIPLSLPSAWPPQTVNPQNIAAAQVSIPGLRQLMQKGYPIIGKILWAIAIVMCVALCLYQIFERFQKYLEQPLDFSLSLRRQQWLDFPSLTICTSDAPLFNPQYNVLFQQLMTEKQSIPSTEKMASVPFWEIMNLDDITIDILWKLLNIDLKYIELFKSSCRPLSSCFKKMNVSTYKGECTKIFTEKKIHHVGANTGFSVKINSRNPKESPKSDVLSIYFHENDWEPTYFRYYDQEIDHGYEMSVSLTRRQQFVYLNQSTNPCEDTKAVANCWRACLDRIFSQNLTCRLPCTLNFSQPLCSSTNEVHTAYKTIVDLFEAGHKGRCHCPRRCNEVIYTAIWDVMRTEPEGATIIHVHIPDDSIEIFEEYVSYTFVRLLCDLGGTLGLFLGFCVLTVLELVETLIQFVHLLYEKWRRPITKLPKRYHCAPIILKRPESRFSKHHLYTFEINK